MAFHLLDSLEKKFYPHAQPDPLENERKRFFYAMEKDDPFALREVAERHLSVFKTWESKDGPPLKTAQAWGSFEAFVTLIDLGCDRNTDYGGGWTPLLVALNDGRREFIDFILEAGPGLDAVAIDSKGRRVTALKLAIDRRDDESLAQLIKSGADTTLGIELRDGTMVKPEDYARLQGAPKMAELLRLAPQVRQLEERTSANLKPVPAPAAGAPPATA